MDLIDVLTAAAEDISSIQLGTIKAARALVIDSEWVQAQSAADQQGAIEKARIVYNLAQEWRRHCTDEEMLRRNSRAPALSLVPERPPARATTMRPSSRATGSSSTAPSPASGPPGRHPCSPTPLPPRAQSPAWSKTPKRAQTTVSSNTPPSSSISKTTRRSKSTLRTATLSEWPCCSRSSPRRERTLSSTRSKGTTTMRCTTERLSAPRTGMRMAASWAPTWTVG